MMTYTTIDNAQVTLWEAVWSSSMGEYILHLIEECGDEEGIIDIVHGEVLEELNEPNSTFIPIKAGGTKDGIPYGLQGFEIVEIDEGTLAYRYIDDSINEDWALANPSDLARLIIDRAIDNARA